MAMMEELVNIQKEVARLYKDGIISFTPEYIQLRPDAFKALAHGHQVDVHWIGGELEAHCVIEGTKLLTLF